MKMATKNLQKIIVFNFLFSFFINATWAAKCGSDSASYHNMPKVIGRPNEIFRSPFILPCDSMVVQSGDTTTIHEFSMVHFGNTPSTNSKITVEGTLIIKGKPEHPVYLSGNIKQGPTGYAPGDAKWGGIEVEAGGTIQFENARIFNAPTPISLMSKNVNMINTYFQGGISIVLPDTTFPLLLAGTTVDTIDLIHPAGKVTKNKKQSSNSGTAVNSGSQNKVWLYSAVGIVILAIGGYTLWTFTKKEDSQPPVTPPVNGLDPVPDLPTSKFPR